MSDNRRLHVRLASLVCFSLISATIAPYSLQSSEKPQITRVTSEAIIVDVIVRDKRGRPVKDLRAEEVEVFEDGIKQELVSFHRIDSGSIVGAPSDVSRSKKASRPPGQLPAESVPLRLISLVFDRQNPESARLSRGAATYLLKEDLPENVFVGVFAVGRQLYVVEPFSRDLRKLRKAVDTVTSQGPDQFASISEAIKAELAQARAIVLGAGETSEQGPAGERLPASAGGGHGEKARAKVTLDILSYALEIEVQARGRSSLLPLLALARGQRQLAGRKAVIFFSEGLHVSGDIEHFFQEAIAEANRSNVSIYAVDARGLTEGAILTSARKALEEAAATSRSQVSRQSSELTREDIMAAEKAEDSIRMNVQGMLEQLAVSTGGFLIGNTNDLRPGIQRITEDILHYYELAYVPKTVSFDGKFRAISVRVSRPDVEVQARSGYFALPLDTGIALSYEAPLLAALASADLQTDFEHRASLLRFGSDGNATLQALMMEAPFAQFTYALDKEKNLHTSQFSFLALVKNSMGEVIKKFSQNYPLRVSLDRLDALKKGNVVLMRYFRLQPGTYLLETVAYDHRTGSVSARRSEIEVEPAGPGVQLSTLCVVREVQKAEAEAPESSNPLRSGELKIVPNLEGAVSRHSNLGLTLFMVIYPSDATQDKPELTLELRRSDEIVAHGTPPLPSADRNIGIPYIANVPISNLQPGQYEIRAEVKQGSSVARERTFVTIVP